MASFVLQNLFNLLPSELVSAILFKVFAAYHSSLEQHRAPARLARICRRFRDIVYESPVLWTTVVIYYDLELRHLPVYLTRSGEMPLHIETHLPGGPFHGEEIKESIAPVLAQSHRWKSLTARGDLFLTESSLINLVPPSLPMPQLSRLSLSLPYPSNEFAVKCSVPPYPGLRALDISDFYIDPQSISVTSLQELILKIEITNPDIWGSLSTLLHSNPALCKLRLILGAESTWNLLSPFDSYPIVELPHLLNLTIEYSRFVPIRHVLEKFQAPQLSELHLQANYRNVGLSKSKKMRGVLTTCLQRSGALKQIVLTGLPSGECALVKRDCSRLGMSEMNSLGGDLTVRVNHEVWVLRAVDRKVPVL